MATADKLNFCEQFVYLNREPISFADRLYLPAIYASCGRNLVLRCSRQTEKSTFLVNTILYEACTNPGVQILFICPRIEQARVFSHSRLLPALGESPLVRRVLLGKRARQPQITNMQFSNGSALFVRAAYRTADACRGLSAQLLLVDEFQDVAEGDLPVMQETLSHAKNGRTILTGTPKSVDNHLEGMFRQSTANEWTLICGNCQKAVILDEHALGNLGVACPSCGSSLDPSAGRWVARNPQATWGDGFWVGHPMVPWLNFDDILERRRTYDLARFKNEVLGLPTTIGDHIVTRLELEACCGRHGMAKSRDDIPVDARGQLVAGIDWGGGGTARTVLIIGYMRSDFVFQVFRMEKFPANEDPEHVLSSISNRCSQFRVAFIAADGGGNGHVYNRLLLDKLQSTGNLYAILYSASDHPPRQDGALWKWTVNRSASIGVLFTRVKKQKISFPRVEESGSFLDEFACEVAEYDDINRMVRYSHPETQPDDALHATNYALLVATRAFNSARTYDDE